MDLVDDPLRLGVLASDPKSSRLDLNHVQAHNLSQMNSEHDKIKPVSENLAIDKDLVEMGYGNKAHLSPVHVVHAHLVNYETSAHQKLRDLVNMIVWSLCILIARKSTRLNVGAQ
ncbi:uncharacterized protein A4U43_C05F3980 [Asparagus officinalis]|uniref:Uncharacterized protein n=1 Tax=Asparagus officinalis TaxID=4686 RepID=A0A5P1ERP9_ASPOF|nr:uncharacterized protein A4U43_C05F3980 [Asparagus officinalis]